MTDPRYPIGKFVPPTDYTPDLRASLVRDIAAAPALFRSAVEGLTTEQRLTPYRDGGWTVAQVVHHVADSHMHSYVRMKFAATEDVPTIKPYNEAIWANMPDASDPDIDPSLRLIESLHARWSAFLSEPLARGLRPPTGASGTRPDDDRSDGRALRLARTPSRCAHHGAAEANGVVRRLPLRFMPSCCSFRLSYTRAVPSTRRSALNESITRCLPARPN